MERQHAGAGPETTGSQEGQRQREASRLHVPRIYVASLSDYNAGLLHGVWIDADQEPDELLAGINAMLSESREPHAEEFAVHDYDGFGRYRVEEYASLERISRVARGIREHGLAFAAWAEMCNDDEELGRFEDAYLGDYESVEDYAESFIEDIGVIYELENAVADHFKQYLKIDVQGFARDLEYGGDITTVDHTGGVWVFEGDCRR